MNTFHHWHTLEVTEAISALESSADSGLSTEQVKERKIQHGPNEFVERGARTALQILWRQARSPMVLILIGAALLAGLIGDANDRIAIVVLAGLYALAGLIQEYRAEKVIATLRKMSIPNVRVLRNGTSSVLPARDLVPGDVVQLEAGNIVPADLRLIEVVNLRIQNSALTAESEGMEKHTAAISGGDLPITDRRNMAYMGSMVTQGRALALVVETSMRTELGKIADLILQVQQEETPLQRRLNSLGISLAWIGGSVIAFTLLTSLVLGDNLRYILLAATSVAIAIVPEGLPIVVTITLLLGADRMFQREIFIRKLPAVETLGSVTVICSDKTGTLTENRMTVVVLDVAEHALDLTEQMDRGGSLRTTRGLGSPVQSSLSLAAIGGALCNDAQLIDEGDDRFHTLGDPTEGSLVVAAAKMGYWKSALDASFPRAAEHPFDTDRKRMTTVHHLEQYDPAVLAGLEVEDRRYIAFTKGNVNDLLDVTSSVWIDGKPEPLDEEWRSRINAAQERLSKKGMRVLGVAFRLLDTIPEIIQTDLEQNLTLVGLFGMIDPPRVEVQVAVANCRTAGIRPVMITSDHPSTAIEIARQLGITENARTLRGEEIENLSLDELKNVVDEVNVFARVAPEHKLKIVQALQARGHVVAITGDGLNDGPALRQADVGVAMGISGTDVSREASDIVLFDDNFATIVTAVEEGRTISQNIRRFLHFAVAGNIAKALVMSLAPFVAPVLPILPLQLLWLNLLIDSLLGIGIGVEKPGQDVMRRKPDPSEDGLLSQINGMPTVWIGALSAALAMALGLWYYRAGRAEWQSMIFASLGFIQIFHAYSARAGRESLFRAGIRSNLLFTGMTVLAMLLQFAAMYVSPLSGFLGLVPLRSPDLFAAASMGLVVFTVMEIYKKRSR
jgi:Ca2+-transporting ATPase